MVCAHVVVGETVACGCLCRGLVMLPSAICVRAANADGACGAA